MKEDNISMEKDIGNNKYIITLCDNEKQQNILSVKNLENIPTELSRNALIKLNEDKTINIDYLDKQYYLNKFNLKINFSSKLDVSGNKKMMYNISLNHKDKDYILQQNISENIKILKTTLIPLHLIKNVLIFYNVENTSGSVSNSDNKSVSNVTSQIQDDLSVITVTTI